MHNLRYTVALNCVLLLICVSCSTILKDEVFSNDLIFNFKPTYTKVEWTKQAVRGESKRENDLGRITIHCDNTTYSVDLEPGGHIISDEFTLNFHGKQDEKKTYSFSDLQGNLKLVNGKIIDHPDSYIEGIIRGDGAFDGILVLSNQSYIIEPANIYFNDSDFNSVFYKYGDLNRTYICSVLLTKSKSIYLSRFCKDSNKESQPPSSDFLLKLSPPIFKRPEELVSLKGKACNLKVIADHLFYKNVGGSNLTLAMEEIIAVIERVDALYQNIDFNMDGESDRIGFVIKEIEIYMHERYESNLFTNKVYPTAFEYLETFSRYDLSDFCLGLGLTYRLFADNAIGLAYVGQTHEYSSGICARRVQIEKSGVQNSYNSAIMTYNSMGRIVPRLRAILTVAHEFGHSFGSPHDPPGETRCYPEDSAGGKFIMYEFSIRGDNSNNWSFSTCSVKAMWSLLVSKGSCLVERVRSICGNGIVEPGEECDCGSSKTCHALDHCCTPSNAMWPDGKPCTIRRKFNYTCSIKSPCCGMDCKPIPKDSRKVCYRGDDCRTPSFCNGQSAECLVYVNNRSTTCLRDMGTCSNGQCRTYACNAIKKPACICKGQPQFWHCKSCCIHEGKCIPFKLLTNNVLLYRNRWFAPEGISCKDGDGNCNGDGYCLVTRGIVRLPEVVALISLSVVILVIGSWMFYNRKISRRGANGRDELFR